MNGSVIKKTVFFDADPDTVWAFLTDKDKLGAWYHPAEADLQPGQDYKLYQKGDDGERKTIIWGRVIAMDAPRKLVTTFCIQPFGDKETTVTIELIAIAGGTHLLLTHEGVPEAAGDTPLPMLMALDKGWDEHLGQLRDAPNPRS